MYHYFATHALIPKIVLPQIQKYYDFSPKASSQSSECNVATDTVKPNDDDINIYNIYAPHCFSTNVTAQPKKAFVSDNFLF
jgi:serine carboxypeptidase-like clade 2